MEPVKLDMQRLETARIVARAAGKLLNIPETDSPASPTIGQAPPSLLETPAVVNSEETAPVRHRQRPLLARLTLCWQILVGHA